MASSPWYKTERVAAMAPLQLCLAVFRDFRRGGKKIHAQPMGSTEMVIGNGFHHLETKSCAEEIQDPSTLVTLVLEFVM